MARLAPRPDAEPSVRRLPMTRPSLSTAVTLDVSSVAPATPTPVATPLALASSAAPTPLSPDRYKVQFTIGGETLEKLRLAKDLLRHAIPSGDDAAILDRALNALLADIARKKFAGTDHPRKSRETAGPSRPIPAGGSRHIPAEVKRAVWLRDVGRCAFVGASRRCSERAFLEFHHVKPHAVGGEATVENVQLRCRRHNAYEARVYFGRGHELVPERVAAGPGVCT